MDIMTAFYVFKSLCLVAIAIPVIAGMAKDWRKPTTDDTSDKVGENA